MDATNGDQNDDSSVQRAFVYGTLRNSGSNRYVVSEYVDECIDSCFIYGSMFYYGEGGHFPYVNEGGNQKVLGEVLTMTDWDAALDRMDNLEGYPTLYCRKVQPVYKLSDPDANPILAWVYFMQPSQESRGAPIPSGDWIEGTG